MHESAAPATFTGFIDLADERLGGKALAASDEFFAPKENLLKPGVASFDPDKYIDTGKWMDGWESRRKRVPGHDWCIVRLGLAGEVHGADIDTSHFLGNHPPYAMLEGGVFDQDSAALAAGAGWQPVLGRVALAPGSHNLFPAQRAQRCTHVRLNIYPDGGVARLRVFGSVSPDWNGLAKGKLVDVAAMPAGGVVVAASDMFFGSKENLIAPWTAESMRDGWETRRRRGPGHDWAIVRLGRAGSVRRVEVDTKHFKGNYPDRCSIEGCHVPDAAVDALNWNTFEWRTLLPETPLTAHNNHVFERELVNAQAPCTHVRLSVYPDGGVSRLRVLVETG